MIVEREVLTNVTTLDNRYNLKDKQRMLASDGKELIFRIGTKNYSFNPEYEEDRTTLAKSYFDSRVKALTVNSIKDPDMLVPMLISEINNRTLDPEFTSTSIIGALNELKEGAGSIWEIYGGNSDCVRVKEDLNVQFLYIASGFLSLYNPDPLFIGDALNTELDSNYYDVGSSIIGAFNQIAIDIVNYMRYPDTLYWNLGTQHQPALTAYEEFLETFNSFYLKIRGREILVGLLYKHIELWHGDWVAASLYSIHTNTTAHYLEYRMETPIGNGTTIPYGRIKLYSEQIKLKVTDRVLFNDDKWAFYNVTNQHFFIPVENISSADFQFGDVTMASIYLKAVHVYAMNNSKTIDLLNLDGSIYPSAIYYQNDPSAKKFEAISTGSQSDGMISWYSLYTDSNDSKYHAVRLLNFGIYSSSNSAYNWSMTYLKGEAVTNRTMYIGSHAAKTTADELLGKIYLYANQVYIKNDSAEYDLFTIATGGLYPRRLYDINQAIRAEAVVGGLSLEGGITYNSYNTSVTDRLAMVLSRDWLFGFDDDDTTNYAELLLEYSGSTPSGKKINIGAPKEKTAANDFIDAIYLRAKEVRIKNGSHDIDLFTISSGSGLSKQMIAKRITSSQSISSSNPYQVIYNSEDADDDGAYVPSTGTYTATVAGCYVVSASIAFTIQTAGQVQIRITKNDATIQSNAIRPGVAISSTVSVSTNIKLAIGDTLKVVVYQDTGYAMTVLQTDTSEHFQSSSFRVMR